MDIARVEIPIILDARMGRNWGELGGCVELDRQRPLVLSRDPAQTAARMGWPSPAKNLAGSPPADPLFQRTRGPRLRLVGSIPFDHPPTPATPGGSRSGGTVRRPDPVSARRSEIPCRLVNRCSRPRCQTRFPLPKDFVSAKGRSL